MLETPSRSKFPSPTATSSDSRVAGGSPRRFADRVFVRRLDLWLALILITLCTLNLTVIPLPYYRASLSVLDESWNLDLVSRAAHNSWLGRDAVFTYGPLYQWLSSLAPRARGSDLGATFANLPVFWFVGSILLLYGFGAILLRKQPIWKRCFFLLLIVVFWSPTEVRISTALFTLAVSLWAYETAGLSPRGLAARAFACSTLVILAFLISADSGFYSLAAVLFAALAHSIRGPKSEKLRLAGLTLLFLVIKGLAVNAW